MCGLLQIKTSSIYFSLMECFDILYVLHIKFLHFQFFGLVF